jgi:hypothetical protein
MMLYANVSWFSDGITPETVTWGCCWQSDFFFRFCILCISTIRTCVRSPVTKGRILMEGTYAIPRAVPPLLLKSSRVVFGIIIHPISETLFFTHDRTSRARPASSVFFSHTCFTPRLCCCWQSKALFLKCNRPTAISQVIRYRLPPTFAQSRRECDMYNIWHSNFLGWKRKKLLRLYCWERRNRQCQSTRFALNQKDWCQDCRVLDIHPLSLSLWPVFDWQVFIQISRAANWTSSFTNDGWDCNRGDSPRPI